MRAMKDSGVDWIGEIPIQWQLVPTKRVFKGKKQIAGANSEMYERLALTMNGVVKRNKDDNEGLQPEQFDSYQILESNELVFKLIDLQNIRTSRVGLSPYTGIVSPAYIILTNTKSDNRFYYYWYFDMYNRCVFNRMGGDGVRSALNLKDVLEIPIPMISDAEQQRIAEFLDRKCAEVDEMIALQEQIIEELKAYKQSVITEAVTKGLNPTAPMRDSGIEWIGSIPEHWEVRRIGSLFRLRDEKNYKPMGEVQLLSLYTGIGVFPHGEQEERGNKAVTTEGYKIVRKNDVVVNIILAWMGAIGVSNYDGVTSPAYDVYIPNHNAAPHYYHYVFRTKGIAAECYKYGRGIMMMRWRTYSSEFKQIHIPYPNIAEQQAIADYLDEKCADIDSLIQTKQSKIDSLKEYKKSIIYEYVTGKREVEL